MIIPIFLCLLVFVEESVNNSDYIKVQPTKQIARAGSIITLKCRVRVLKNFIVHWVKDGFGLGNSRADIRQYGKPMNNSFRYDLPFNENEGEFDLRITDLELSDEGLFYCQFVLDGAAYSSEKAMVQVLVASQPPKLIQRSNQGQGPMEEKNDTNPIIVNDGERLYIECISENGRPAADLFWYVNDMNIARPEIGGINGSFSGEIVNSTTTAKNTKLYNSISKMNIQISSIRHGNWIKCVAICVGFEIGKLKPAIAKIEVHTPPLVKMEAHPARSSYTYTENDVIEFSCSATGRPNVFSWKWYLNDKKVSNIIENKYKLRMDRSLHRSSLKCVAVSTREGYTSIQISVKYGPKFLNENVIMYAASVGENAELSCKTDSNPEANIYWQRESSKEIISRDTEYIRKNIQDEDFGIYRCTAVAKGFSSVYKNAYLSKKKAPTIQQPSVSYGREGRSARLSCSIDSVPLPSDNEIKWMFRNEVISKSPRHKSYQEAFPGGVITVLQILTLTTDDFGDYNCSVRTSLGSATSRVILTHKGETPVLMIVGAAIIFLFILLATTVVLCICRKNQYKNEYEKGNPSSPEIPVHHDAKSSLIDSDCHCNPNLYSWIPQTSDLKENRGLANKVHNQDEHLWTKANDMASSYPNYLSGGYPSNKSIPINQNENLIYNPLIYHIQNNSLEPADLNNYPSNFPFATLSISRNPHDHQSQTPNYLYQDFCKNMNVQVPMNLHNNDIPSPVYLMKKNANHKARQFPVDYFPPQKPMINNYTIDSSSSSNNKLVSDYASNI